MGINRALTGSTFTRTELKTGRRPPPKNVKIFPPGSPLFLEGEVGRELFIISEGEIKITKGTKDDEVQLAVLGPGAILGEMSLLDKQPRSASATTIKETKAVIINEATFNAVASLLPIWLTSIIRIVTSRLRDTNKSIGTSILKNREKAVCHLLYMLGDELAEEKQGNERTLDYYNFVSEVQFITKLKSGDVAQNLKGLEDKKLIRIVPATGTKHIVAKNFRALKYYVEFLSAKDQSAQLPIIAIGKEGVQVLEQCLAIFKEKGTNKAANSYLLREELERILSQKVKGFSLGMLKPLGNNGFLKYQPPNESSKKGYYVLNPANVTDSLDSLPWVESFNS